MSKQINKQIEVYYNHPADLTREAWVAGRQRFSDWFDFAEWLRQRLLKGHAVLITSWEYVDSKPAH